MSGSKVLRFLGDSWEGVPVRRYRDDDTERGVPVQRHTLLGAGPGEESLGFETRYFSVAAGSSSSLERHAHAHAVVILDGSGEVTLGDRVVALSAFDVVFVAPWEVHRFQASADESLGFLCVVDRERDRPERVEENR